MGLTEIYWEDLDENYVKNFSTYNIYILKQKPLTVYENQSINCIPYSLNSYQH